VKAEITGQRPQSTPTTKTETFSGPPDFRDLDIVAAFAQTGAL
jgi:hypothetical protein